MERLLALVGFICLPDTLDAHVVLEAYDDDIGGAVDITEAYVEWRPVPRSATRYRVRAGMFYPKLSLENTGPGWTSPYTLSASAINSWVAEEIRTTGIDLGVAHRPPAFGGAQTFAANLTVFARGQYGWYTEFDHVAIRAAPSLDLGLFAQWMGGSTMMGPFLGEWHAVEADYEAAYLTLTRVFGMHRVTLRYDDFSVTDNDGIPDDDSSEDGDAWTLAYQYALNSRATLAFEWLGIRSSRPAWAYFGAATTATERQAQLAVRLAFLGYLCPKMV